MKAYLIKLVLIYFFIILLGAFFERKILNIYYQILNHCPVVHSLVDPISYWCSGIFKDREKKFTLTARLSHSDIFL